MNDNMQNAHSVIPVIAVTSPRVPASSGVTGQVIVKLGIAEGPPVGFTIIRVHIVVRSVEVWPFVVERTSGEVVGCQVGVPGSIGRVVGVWIAQGGVGVVRGFTKAPVGGPVMARAVLGPV